MVYLSAKGSRIVTNKPWKMELFKTRDLFKEMMRVSKLLNRSDLKVLKWVTEYIFFLGSIWM